MRNWKYTLKAGKQLRALINAEDMEEEEQQVAILKQLEVCYKELLERDKHLDEYDRDDVEENLSLLDGEDHILHLFYAYDAEWFEYGWDSAEDLVNTRLDDFYNLCDACDVWIDL